jgi:hypothetical protein
MLHRIFVPVLAFMLSMPGHDGIAASNSAQFSAESYLTTKTKKKPAPQPNTAQKKRTNFKSVKYNCSNWSTMTESDFIRCGYEPPFWAKERGRISD